MMTILIPSSPPHHGDVSEIVDVETFTPSGSSKSNPIAVDRYSKKVFIDLDLPDDDDDIVLLSFAPENTPFGRRRRTEVGQSGSEAVFMCEICVEPKPPKESFSIKGCSHAYCEECMNKYVASKLQVGCPVSGCPGALEPQLCQRILPKEVFDRWGDSLCEAVILGAHRFYCPYRDCSAMLIGLAVRESECPYCRRMFCAQCRVPWHGGVACEEFQKLGADERGREDLMLRQLAKNNNWHRCPTCTFYVEKVQGCAFVTCRCRAQFCYRCGTKVQKDHYCAVCKSS